MFPSAGQVGFGEAIPPRGSRFWWNGKGRGRATLPGFRRPRALARGHATTENRPSRSQIMSTRAGAAPRGASRKGVEASCQCVPHPRRCTDGAGVVGARLLARCTRGAGAGGGRHRWPRGSCRAGHDRSECQCMSPWPSARRLGRRPVVGGGGVLSRSRPRSIPPLPYVAEDRPEVGGRGRGRRVAGNTA